jgi:hypothetical protein
MDRQALAGVTMLVKSREMTGRSQTLAWWLGEEGVKTTEIKIHWLRWPRGYSILPIFQIQDGGQSTESTEL